MSSYYVVPFTNDEYRAFCRQEFRLRVGRIIFESALRAKRRPGEVGAPAALEAYCYTPLSRRVPELVEYDGYPITIFFSEGYIRLYEDVGIPLSVQKVISAEALPEGLESMGSGTYYPKQG